MCVNCWSLFHEWEDFRNEWSEKISHVDIDMRIYDYKLRISWLNHAITQCFLLYTYTLLWYQCLDTWTIKTIEFSDNLNFLFRKRTPAVIFEQCHWKDNFQLRKKLHRQKEKKKRNQDSRMVWLKRKVKMLNFTFVFYVI